MAIFIKGREVTGFYRKGKIVSAIYYCGKLLWVLGNFFTKDKMVFFTKDRESFEVKEA